MANTTFTSSDSLGVFAFSSLDRHIVHIVERLNGSGADGGEARFSKERSISFSGVGTVDLGTGAGGFFTDVPFEVTVMAGGPGVGTLQLTVIGAFDGVPGDTIIGNGNYDLPVETVSNGLIRIH